jgi:hypothetical protein
MLVRGEIPGVKLGGRWYVTRENLDKLLAGGTAVTASLDPKSEATVERWVAQAPPLSEKQKDATAAAFRGALKPKRAEAS